MLIISDIHWLLYTELANVLQSGLYIRRHDTNPSIFSSKLNKINKNKTLQVTLNILNEMYSMEMDTHFKIFLIVFNSRIISIFLKINI